MIFSRWNWGMPRVFLAIRQWWDWDFQLSTTFQRSKRNEQEMFLLLLCFFVWYKFQSRELGSLVPLPAPVCCIDFWLETKTNLSSVDSDKFFDPLVLPLDMIFLRWNGGPWPPLGYATFRGVARNLLGGQKRGSGGRKSSSGVQGQSPGGSRSRRNMLISSYDGGTCTHAPLGYATGYFPLRSVDCCHRSVWGSLKLIQIKRNIVTNFWIITEANVPLPMTAGAHGLNCDCIVIIVL